MMIDAADAVHSINLSIMKEGRKIT